MNVHGKLIDIHTGDIYSAVITIENGIISKIDRDGHRSTQFILPGFVDGFMHIESSHLPPSEFGRICIRHGTIGAATHEQTLTDSIGPPGIDYLLQNAHKSPIKFSLTPSFTIPSTLAEGKDLWKAEEPVVLTETNLSALLPLLKEDPSRCFFASEYRRPDQLLLGHINLLVKKAIQLGVDPAASIRAATQTPAEYHNLGLGLLREGDSADFILVEDLDTLRVNEVYIQGECMFKDSPLFTTSPMPPIEIFSLKSKKPSDFAAGKINLIGKTDKSPIETKEMKDFSVPQGALATSIAHPSYCIAAIGVSNEDIASAVNAVIAAGGGLAFSLREKTDIISLPIGGLFSNDPGEKLARRYADFNEEVIALGIALESPFLTLSRQY